MYTSYNRGPYYNKSEPIDVLDHGISSKIEKIFYNIISEKEFRHQFEGGAL